MKVLLPALLLVLDYYFSLSTPLLLSVCPRTGNWSRCEKIKIGVQGKEQKKTSEQANWNE
jgi:hypothetical protein